VEKNWGKDNQKVVIDEVAGMCISLLLVPLSVPYVAAGLILFRFFDITKPLYIRKAEHLPGGWGVMLDDVLAGIYTNLLLQLVYRSKLF
jgi:phosphatidylglycerophosphatase A